MALPNQFLDELRARVSVSDVAGRGVKLIKRGHEYTALCPFHTEKTPSFTINDDKGFYHCFGCGAHGDVISFLMVSEGYSFLEAIENLASKAGLKMPQISMEEHETARRRADLYEIVEAAAKWFEAQLVAPVARAARAYLEHRGVAEDTRAGFRLGYAPREKGALRRALAEQGFTNDKMAEAGLIKLDNSSRDKLQDRFFNRLIFPITDSRGRVIAFGGRTLGDSRPKYLNSPDTPLFQKGRVLYGLANARNAARLQGALIVVEGYMDVLALAGAGIDHTVAPLGTALTKDQIVLLWRLTDEPVLCFDGDEAGARAAARAAERALPLVQPGKSLGIVSLPSGEDPDSLIAAAGSEAFTRRIAHPRPLVDVIWVNETRGKAVDTPERRADLDRRLQAHANAISDRSVRFQYQSEFRARLRAASAPRNERSSNRVPLGSAGSLTPPGLRGRGDTNALIDHQERILVALLISHPWLIEEETEALAELTLASAPLNEMLLRILSTVDSCQGLDSLDLQNHLKDQGFVGLLQRVQDARLVRQAPRASRDASPESVRVALAEFLAWHRGRHVALDRLAAERELADDMNDTNSEKLLNIGRLRANNSF